MSTGAASTECDARQPQGVSKSSWRLSIPTQRDAFRTARLAPGVCFGAARELPACEMRSRACFARRCFCGRRWDRIRASRGPSQRFLARLSATGAVPRDPLVCGRSSYCQCLPIAVNRCSVCLVACLRGERIRGCFTPLRPSNVVWRVAIFHTPYV